MYANTSVFKHIVHQYRNTCLQDSLCHLTLRFMNQHATSNQDRLWWLSYQRYYQRYSVKLPNCKSSFSPLLIITFFTRQQCADRICTYYHGIQRRCGMVARRIHSTETSQFHAFNIHLAEILLPNACLTEGIISFVNIQWQASCSGIIVFHPLFHWQHSLDNNLNICFNTF